MTEENITFFENDDKSYAMIDLHINSNTYFDYEDSYNYYDIDVKKILLIKIAITNILLGIMMQIDDNWTTAIKNK